MPYLSNLLFLSFECRVEQDSSSRTLPNYLIPFWVVKLWNPLISANLWELLRSPLRVLTFCILLSSYLTNVVASPYLRVLLLPLIFGSTRFWFGLHLCWTWLLIQVSSFLIRFCTKESVVPNSWIFLSTSRFFVRTFSQVRWHYGSALFLYLQRFFRFLSLAWVFGLKYL